MRKRYLIFLLISTLGFAQQDAWVYFKSKSNSQAYLDAPLSMLSQRALDRRTNQKIVLDLKDIPIDASYINQIKGKAGITVLAKSKWLNAIHVRGSQVDLNTLAILPFVDKVDFANKLLNKSAKIAKTTKIKRVDKSEKTKIDFAYGNSANQIEMLNGQVLHQQNFTGAGKMIAIMDSGFPGVNTAQPFQRLRDNNKIMGGYNFVSRDSNFYSGDSHGTLVLSTMGGYTENALIGTAPDASYYLFVTEDDNSENPIEESLWVEAAEKADSLGVDIINTSLGYFDFDDTAYNHTYSEMNGATAFMSRGAEIAFSRGMIVVASAGNSGSSNANPHIAVPADAVSVIAVGAVNAGKNRVSFSSIGPSFDQRIKPEVMAQGQLSVVSDEAGNIGVANGTSFSAPIMAGMIASLWQALPQMTNQQIRNIIIQASDRYANPNNQFGYGIPDFALALSKQLVLNALISDEFIVYPNPTDDVIIIVFPEKVIVGTLFIYNTAGQKMMEQIVSVNSPTVSLKSLDKGIYVYKMESENFSKSGKIIKQ